MLICAAGDILGAMDRLYQDVLGADSLRGRLRRCSALLL